MLTDSFFEKSCIFVLLNNSIKAMFDIDKSKAINSILFVISKLGVEKSDKHKVFKILYFADQKHLVRYGRPITGDIYIKMDYGPVPSYLKDIADGNEKKGLIKIEGKFYLSSSYPYSEDEFSESELECLTEAIDENINISFGDLTEKSHDKAWQNATRHIDYMSMAMAVTDDVNILKYIKANQLNEKICFAQ